MTAALVAVVAVAALCVFAWLADRRLKVADSRFDALLDRLQSRSLAEYAAVAPSSPTRHEAFTDPTSYTYDPTGLIGVEDDE